MLKKALAMFLACIALFAAAGCANEKEDTSPSASDSAITEPDTASSAVTNPTPSNAKELTRDVKFEIANKELDKSMLPYKLNLTINVTNNEDYNVDICSLGALFDGYSWTNIPYFTSTFEREKRNTSPYKAFSGLKFPKCSYTINSHETKQTMLYLPLPEGINSEDDIKSLSIYMKVINEDENYNGAEYTYIDVIGSETHGNPPIDGLEKLYDDDEVSLYINKNVICMENHDDIEYVIVNKTGNLVKFLSNYPSYSFSKGGLEEECNSSLSDSILPHSYSHGRFEMPDFHHVYSAQFNLRFFYSNIIVDDMGNIAKANCYDKDVSIEFNHPEI